MPRFNEVINNFINGEVSPKLYGRMDSEVYKRSCRTLKNMISHPQGGASRRVGTLRIAEAVVQNATDRLEAIVDGARIVPFQYDDDEKYLIVFNKYQDSINGDNFIHYYRVDTDAWRGAGAYSGGPIQPSGQGPYASRASTGLSDFDDDDSLQDSTVLEEMQYTQAGAYMVFVHESFPPFVIARISEGVLQMGSYFLQYQASATTEFGPMPFMDLNLSDVTITPSGTTGNVTLTSSSNIFDAGHIGAQFSFIKAGTSGGSAVGHVTAVASGTSASFTFTKDYDSTGATKNWYESAWSDYRGWPRSVTFWNGALYFGGSTTFPDRIWKSQDFDIFEMANPDTQDPGTANTADDPFYADLAVGAQGLSKIQWMYGGYRDLLVGTDKGEVSISSFNVDEVSAKPQTSEGSEQVQPVIVDGVPIYVQRGHRKLREIIFDDRIQGYQSPDITFLAEHMPRLGLTEISGATAQSKIKQMAYQNLDNSIVWVIDNNGFLFGATKTREGNVTAFHRHDVGGKVKSICALPSRDSTFDELYMIVERTINSLTEYYLERLSNEFYEPTLNPGVDTRSRLPLFSDSGVIFQRPDTPNFWAQLKDGTDADISDGTGTGTVTGTATYEFEKAPVDGSNYFTYDGTSNADFAQVGCIRWWCNIDTLKTNTMFAISESAASVNNLIRVRNNNGAIRVTINDSAGSAIINDVLFGTTSVDGPQLFELNYDITTGATRLFVNGTQLGSTNTGTGTRNTSIDNIVIGAHYDGSDPWSDYLYDFSIFDTVQHTADYEMLDFLPQGVKLYKLDDLEGETVQVTADGNYVGTFSVSGGEISDIGADYSTSQVIAVGLPYTSTLEIQPIDLGSGIGGAMGSIKRIDRMVARFRATCAAKVGPDTSNLEDVVFRDDTTPADQPIVPVTDDKRIDFDGDYDRTARAVIQTSDPLPMNVTCISLRGVTGDV